MTLLRLANAAEARSLLAAEDAFTRALGGFDRSFRMRTVEPVADAELRCFLAAQALDFTADEATAWEEVIAAVARAANGMGSLLPAEVLVVKTTGREERNHAYTRANAIFLPAARVEGWRGERAIYLLAHELFHVASRASAALRDATYGVLGFTPIAPIAPPPELDARRLTNPDAFSLDHYLWLGDRAVMPLLICPSPLAEVLERSSALDAAHVSLLVIDPSAGAVLNDAEAAPILIDASTTDWSQRLARNTRYTIHPEEVLADNFALFVRRRLGSEVSVADPCFLAAFEDALLDRGLRTSPA